MADAVACAKAGQTVPQGYYNLELMVKGVARKGEMLLCGTCMDARGINEAELVEGARRSTLDELAERTLAAERVLVFLRSARSPVPHEVRHDCSLTVGRR